MKIIVTSQGADMESEIDQRFARARCLIEVDLETGAHEVVDNTQNLEAMQGAGVQAAQNVVARGVEAVLTGHCGPKAFRVLQAAGVKVCVGLDGKVSAAVAGYKAGDIQPTAAADVEGHWV